MSVEVQGPIQFQNTDHGWVAKSGNAIMFFGDKTSSPEAIKNVVPDISFSFLKQIHSDRILMVNVASQETPEADAQISLQKNIGLAIQTADCVPILITDGKFIAAIHAGWRGLETSIAEKTVKQLRSMGAAPENLKAVIGPHIARQSYEVGRDICDRLLTVFRKLAYNPYPLGYPHEDAQKRYVDLGVLAQAQLIQAGVPEKEVTLLRADTFKDENFHSYRRNKEAAGRQISFIVLK